MLNAYSHISEKLKCLGKILFQGTLLTEYNLESSYITLTLAYEKPTAIRRGKSYSSGSKPGGCVRRTQTKSIRTLARTLDVERELVYYNLVTNN